MVPVTGKLRNGTSNWYWVKREREYRQGTGVVGNTSTLEYRYEKRQERGETRKKSITGN